MQIHESMFLLAQMCFSLDVSGFFMLDVFAIDRLCSSLISFSLIQEIMIPKQEKKKTTDTHLKFSLPRVFYFT